MACRRTRWCIQRSHAYGQPVSDPTVQFAISGAFTAVFAYLTVRIVALVRGPLQLSQRILAVLELREQPRRDRAPITSTDFWIFLSMLAIVEFVMAGLLISEIAQGDLVGVAVLGCHFVLATAWLLFLRSRTRGAGVADDLAS